MQKDFQAFQADKSVKNAKRVLKHADKMSAQCIYFEELQEASQILAQNGQLNGWI